MTSRSIAPYHDKEEWRLARQSGLGGSDASAVAGINPFRTAMDVYLEKTNELPPDEPNWRMQWGNIAEAIAADLYAEKTGRKIRRQPLRRHSEHEFLIANVDRQILAGTGDVTESACLEIKCPGLGSYTKMKAYGLPDYAILQLQHYLGVLGYPWGSFAVFNPEDGPPIHFDMEADQELIEQLFAREIKFWTEHIVPHVPPEVEPNVPSLDIPDIEGELTVVDGEEWRVAAEDMRDARELKTAATALEDTNKEKIQALMHREEIHAAEVPGVAKFYYRWFAGRTKWKQTAIAIAKQAELSIDEFEVKGDGYKRFTSYFMRRQEE